MSTGDIIKRLRVQLGMSAEELGKKVGKDRTTIYRYEKGSIESVPSTIIKELAIALNTTPATLLETGEKTNRINSTLIPIYSALSCGTGTWVDEIPDDYVSVPESMRFSGRAFANFADGDSMTPKIRNGDLLIFQETPQIPSGSVGSFSLNGAYYCKRLKHLPDGSYWLFSDNPEYDPIPITKNDDFRVLGLYKLKISKEQ